MARILRQVDLLLRGPTDGEAPSVRALAVVAVVSGLFYGAVMGSYGGDRAWQMLFSGLKLPLLLLVTFLLSLPSFFVLNTLLGVRADFPEALRALLISQAGLTVVLGALAPYTALWYVSFEGYHAAIVFNALMFTVASVTGQWLLRRAYAPLVARAPVHRLLLRTWLVVYAFVGIQMAWVLRPFIGYPGMPAQFFRSEPWGNAYMAVLQSLWEALRR
jgi:hypothetical protein